MTAAGLRKPSPDAAPAVPEARQWSAAEAGLRLTFLHLIGRRVPSGLGAIAACGVVLWAALHWHWTLGSGTGAQSVPIVLEAGVASVIAVATRSPFGESERATGRWLPYLRLVTTLLLVAASVGALAAGAAIGGGLGGGTLDLLRGVAGLTGIGLLLAAVTGGALAWVGPTIYMVVTEYALVHLWKTPLIWPGRPPHDRGAAICAAAVFAAGLIAVAVRGSRDSAQD